MTNFWDDVGLALLTIVALVVISFLSLALFHEHRVRSYYADRECIYSDIPWEPDDQVYCPANNDFASTVEMLNKLNATLGK